MAETIYYRKIGTIEDIIIENKLSVKDTMAINGPDKLLYTPIDIKQVISSLNELVALKDDIISKADNDTYNYLYQAIHKVNFIYLLSEKTYLKLPDKLAVIKWR